MVARGRVQNGVVVLDNGVRLPEGQEVTVLTPETVPTNARMEGSRPHSVWTFRRSGLVRCCAH
jgi:hypothetical protein